MKVDSRKWIPLKYATSKLSSTCNKSNKSRHSTPTSFLVRKSKKSSEMSTPQYKVSATEVSRNKNVNCSKVTQTPEDIQQPFKGFTDFEIMKTKKINQFDLSRIGKIIQRQQRSLKSRVKMAVRRLGGTVKIKLGSAGSKVSGSTAAAVLRYVRVTDRRSLDVGTDGGRNFKSDDAGCVDEGRGENGTEKKIALESSRTLDVDQDNTSSQSSQSQAGRSTLKDTATYEQVALQELLSNYQNLVVEELSESEGNNEKVAREPTPAGLSLEELMIFEYLNKSPVLNNLIPESPVKLVGHGQSNDFQEKGSRGCPMKMRVLTREGKFTVTSIFAGVEANQLSDNWMRISGNQKGTGNHPITID